MQIDDQQIVCLKIILTQFIDSVEDAFDMIGADQIDEPVMQAYQFALTTLKQLGEHNGQTSLS